MNFLEKINQLEKWDNEGLISNEKHEKFNKIFKLVEDSNKSLKETKNKIAVSYTHLDVYKRQLYYKT